jgi:predicted O-linked N-acetylglucosamine transferase (SPINDLY family)
MLRWLRSRLKTLSDAAAPEPVDASTHASTHAGTSTVLAAPPPPPPPPPSLLEGPLALYEAGYLAEARQSAQAALALDAGDTTALHALGLIALKEGHPPEALRLLQQATALAPADAALQHAAGLACLACKRPAQAGPAFQRAAELRPGWSAPWVQLGLMALANRKPKEALLHFTAAAAAEPADAQAHFQIGTLLLGERDKQQEVERHYRRALALQPEHAGALCNLGALLKDQGKADEAATFLERAVRLDPALAQASFNLGLLRIDQGRWSEAADALQRSLAAAPSQAEAHYWLGNALMGTGNAPEARKAYQAAFRQDANHVRARWGFAMAQLPAVPQTDEEQRAGAENFGNELGKLKSWFRARPQAEGYLAVGAQQPFYLAYVPGDHRERLADYGKLCTTLMAGWARKVGVPAVAPRSASKRRIGIVSAHVHSHSVWRAIVRGWIEHLDPGQFELHVFHTGSVRDTETEWAARRVARFHHGLGAWTNWAKAISDSQLDTLLYPEISMDSVTLRLAALRLAPQQLASWGHPLTTGLPTIDGYLSAQAFEPDTADAHYTETLIRLPGLGCCYEPFGTAPVAVDLSAWNISPQDKLLLCAGTPFKYAPHDDPLWVRIAQQCRPCKLVFFSVANAPLARAFEQRLRAAFEAAQVDFDACVRFVPWQSQAAFFGWLDRADVFLDSVGFSGFNTAMQAVERGTPIVAWEGDHLRGRFASAILRQIGLDEWVASSADRYVDCVERLCKEAPRRKAVRDTLLNERKKLFGDRSSVDALAVTLSRGTAP